MQSRVRLSIVYALAALAFVACSKSENPTSSQLINQLVTITVDLASGSVTQAGREWVDNAGIVRVQGRITEGQTVSGDLVRKFKTTITNAERNPQTGDSKETMLVECSASWPAQNLQGLFSGEMTQEFKAGSRAPASLNAQGKEGFASFELEVTLEQMVGSANLLVGKGRIVER